MDVEQVKEDILAEVQPDDAERNENQEMFQEIKEFIREEYGRDAALMGSIAKDTFISGDKDLDVFVFFDPEIPEDALEEEGLEIGKAVFDAFTGEYTVEYADHPYTKGIIAGSEGDNRNNGYDVEVVPAYKVETGADIKSAVDRTPFHTEWVNDQLNTEEKQEVILLKAFLRGQSLYGSTLKIEGFSGYLCELLIAEYGSFEAVLEEAVDWEEEQVIDPAGHHDTLPNPLKQKFSEDKLVVIDPVDSERNVAAVLNDENYATFIYRAWRFLQEPDTAFFFPEPEPMQKVDIEKGLYGRGDFVQVTFPTPDIIDDQLYPQLRRLHRRLTDVLEDGEFRIFESGFHVGDEETRFLFELYTDTLPDVRKQVGPTVFHNEEHVQNFVDKYGEVWVEDDRLVTIVDREHTDAHELLGDFLTGDLQAKGVPKQLVPVVGEREVSDVTVGDGEDHDWYRFLRDTFRLVE